MSQPAPVAAPNQPAEGVEPRSFNHNLPVQPAPLVGREREVEGACELLRRPDVRLLTLTGPPGTGKTRLSIQIAASLLHDFTDGVYFVPLAPLNDPGLVASAIAQALDVKEAGSRPLIESLSLYLRDKELLLLLDNFEHLIDGVQIISDLLAAAPRVKIVATSRELLRLSGEHDFPVPPLSLPPLLVADTSARLLSPLPPERLGEYHAVQLFMQRAVALKPDFALTENNASHVAEICRQLDGLPLAIELAAARIRHLPPQVMLDRLQRRLQLLTGGARDLPPRHQTLQAAIEWSYSLLNEPEQRLFRRLAVFRGGRTLEAIEAVCNLDGDLGVEALDEVSSLLDKNLLSRQERVGGEPRYIMLETIHEYAREKLEESGEAEVLRRHHAEYFLAMADEAEQQLSGPKRSEWLDRLEDELDNFRAALAWLLRPVKHPKGRELKGEETDADKALRLGAAFLEFWHGRHYEEGKRWLEEVLATSSVRPTSHRSKALRAAGILAHRQGDAERARSLFEEWLATARHLGDKRRTAEALKWLGNVSTGVHDGEARARYQESLALYRELEDKEGIGNILNNMGEIAREEGKYDEAIALYEESLRLVREVGVEVREVGGHAVTIAIGSNNLGYALYNRGDYASARTLFTEALVMWRELSYLHGSAESLVGLAGVAQAHGEAARAARLLAAAQVMLETTGGVLSTADLADYDHIVQAARAQLDEQAWQQAWEEGGAMPVEEAIAYAQLVPVPQQLDKTRQGRTSPRRDAKLRFGGLTRREREVAALIAQGKSNREIAHELVLGERTVEGHVSNILSKLGFQSRSQISAWVVRQSLTNKPE